jgi:hypothetical protein
MKMGMKYGDWEIIRIARPAIRDRGQRIPRVFCKCDCGEIRAVEFPSLKYGRSKSCGHRKRLTGSQNPSWRGGRTRHAAGYVVINGTKIRGKYPDRKLEHTVVMEKILGRKLFLNETVHHKNGIRSDNRPTNLELWASHHPSGQRVTDLIKFAIEILRTYQPEELR